MLQPCQLLLLLLLIKSGQPVPLLLTAIHVHHIRLVVNGEVNKGSELTAQDVRTKACQQITTHTGLAIPGATRGSPTGDIAALIALLREDGLFELVGTRGVPEEYPRWDCQTGVEPLPCPLFILTLKDTH